MFIIANNQPTNVVTFTLCSKWTSLYIDTFVYSRDTKERRILFSLLSALLTGRVFTLFMDIVLYLPPSILIILIISVLGAVLSAYVAHFALPGKLVAGIDTTVAGTM